MSVPAEKFKTRYSTFFEITPDWVCEVLSPSTAKQDRIEKMPIYAREGVAHCWLIDPDLQTLEVYVLENGYWLLWQTYQNQAAVCATPFAALTFALGDLWLDAEVVDET